MKSEWDAIVVGSGIGGMTCAAALAKFGYRVLVLERHAVAGGLTQTFSRHGWTWSVGIHYLGDMGPGGRSRQLLDWLTDGAIEMASLGPVYDTLRFPGGFELPLSRPEESLKMELRDRFPAAAREIDAYFAALRDAQHAGQSVFALRGMPQPVADVSRFFHGRAIDKWCGRTTQAVIEEHVTDPRLRAVLAAQWGDYGGLPNASCFGIHATIVAHYFAGACYPEGGAGVFAREFGRTIEGAGGRMQVNAAVAGAIVEDGAVHGVRLADGTEQRAPRVVSNIGARNTLTKLLPEALRASDWARAILDLGPSPGHLSLFLGFEGDIAAHGATRSNHWVYDTWNPNEALWNDPVNTPVPMYFVSFASLKDPRHDPGPRQKHTGDMLVFLDWSAFADWAGDSSEAARTRYQAFKRMLEQKLLAAFEKRFPALMPLLKFCELSTPLTTAGITGAFHGATYGLETTPRRFLSPALNARTPVAGLYLSGQDVGTPGVPGAMWGGLMTAGAIEPRVFLQT